jgi:hypothetical protein
VAERRAGSVVAGVVGLAVLLVAGLFVLLHTNPPVGGGTEAAIRRAATTAPTSAATAPGAGTGPGGTGPGGTGPGGTGPGGTGPGGTAQAGPGGTGSAGSGPSGEPATAGAAGVPSPTALPPGATMETFSDPQGRYHVVHPSTWATAALASGNGVTFNLPGPSGNSVVLSIVLRVTSNPTQKQILVQGFLADRQPGDQSFPVSVAGRAATAVEKDGDPNAGAQGTECTVYVDIGPGVAAITYVVTGPAAAGARQQFLDALGAIFVP